MSDSVQPHRWQPTRLLCPWDSPGRILEWVAFPSPMQAPLSMGFSRQEYWSGLPLILGKHENSGLGETQEAAQLAMLEPAGRKQELGCRKEAGNRD